MSTSYKLYYFNARGRAEISRFIFAQAGITYEDIRFTGEQWGSEFKSKSPFGTSPWLEVDGVAIGGSLNMARYLGETFGLAGSNAIENAQIAAIVDCYNDCADQALKPAFEKDETKKAELTEKFLKDCPKWFDNFEKRIIDQKSGWIFGPRLTWADITLAAGLHMFAKLFPKLLDSYPNLKALKEKVEAQENIAKWIKDRPVTEF